MKELSWRLNRLSKMSPAEIGHRLWHQLHQTIDRNRPVLPIAATLTQGIDIERLAALSCHVHAEALAKWSNTSGVDLIQAADALCRNQCTIFGIHHDFGEQVDWHLDVKTGKHWPLAYWADVNIRDGFTIGGPKFVWETNRLYCLNILGMAFRLSGEPKYADRFLSIVSSWLDANPYPYGVNWTSGIELGVRIANLIWGLSFMAERNWTGEEMAILHRFAWLHGRHLYRYPSKYSSNNNHAIAEAFALFLIGVYLPGFTEAGQWLAFGREVLDREGLRQILADGGSHEYSTTYLSFVFDFFLLYKLVCEKQNLTYAEGLNDRLLQACTYIHALADQHGHLPNIGDQDSAILVDFCQDNHANFHSILNTGSLLFNRPEFRRGDIADFKTLVLLGETAPAAGASLPEKAERGGCRTLFPHSGLAVIRGEMRAKEIVFVGIATPLGMPPLYAHGHLDALSFTLSVAGEEFFVDPGTYLYHSGGKWRRYFRSTAAHNTIRINATELSEQTGDFMFGKPYRITEHALRTEGNTVIWRGGHDAYQRFANPVDHSRQVDVDFVGATLTINDTLTSNGPFAGELFFHLHPLCKVSMDSTTVTLTRQDVVLQMTVDPRLTLQAVKGKSDPFLGWYSPAFNVVEETACLVCQGDFDGNTTLRTTISLDALV